METKNNDKTLLKTILLDFLKPWMEEKPDVRTQKYICLKCTSISQSKLSRVLDDKSTTCPTFDETIELMMFIDKPEAMDRFIRTSKSSLSTYLRTLKNYKGGKLDAEAQIDKTEDKIANINDNLSLIRQELTWRASRIDIIKGLILGIGITTFMFLHYQNFINIFNILSE